MNVKVALVKHAPAIKIGVGLGLGVTSMLLAADAVPKAQEIRNRMKAEKVYTDLDGTVVEPELTRKEVWKSRLVYLPAGISYVASVLLIMSAQKDYVQRMATLKAACDLARENLTDYQDVVKEKFGEKKHVEAIDEIAKRKQEANPPTEGNIIVTGGGDSLCFDTLSGRYFYSSVETIQRVINKINQKRIAESYTALNDMYELLGLPICDLGDYLGWNVSDNNVEVSFTSKIAQDATNTWIDGKPCLCLQFDILPHYSYDVLSSF